MVHYSLLGKTSLAPCFSLFLTPSLSLSPTHSAKNNVFDFDTFSGFSLCQIHLAMRFTRLHSARHLTEPSTWRPLTVREICLFPRFPRAVPYNMSFYGVNAAELITQKPNMLSVVKVESLLQPWRKRSSHHKVLSFSSL